MPIVRGRFHRKAGPSYLLSFFNRVPLVGPVCTKIVGQIKYLHIGKAHFTQFGEGWSEIRAAIPGAATAVNYDLLVALEAGDLEL